MEEGNLKNAPFFNLGNLRQQKFTLLILRLHEYAQLENQAF